MLTHALKRVRHSCRALSQTFGLALFLLTANAQTAFPSKPVHLIVPAAAGGGFDVFARLISKPLAEKWGQPIIVENKPGAAGNIAAMHVIRSDPDGHTLLVWNDTMLINPALMKSVPYDPQRDLTPLSLSLYLPNVLVAHPSAGISNFRELVARAKAAPGSLAYASAGNGSTGHLGTELMKQLVGVDIRHVPYKGAAPAVVDVLGGHVPLGVVSVPGAIEYIKAGKLIPLAVSSSTRIQAIPQVPTFIELGMPSYNMSMFMAILGPPGMSRATIDRLDRDFRDVVMTGPISAQLIALGFQPVGGSAQQFSDMIARDLPVWRKLVKTTGAQLD